MDISSAIRPQLWDAIKVKYVQEDYKNAILEAILFLTNIIQDRSDLIDDGAALIGKAFGGNSPRIRVTKMQTTGEKDTQRGIENILRGIYLGIRNQRTHEQYTDDEHTAYAIIVFIDYLLGVIDTSKSVYNKISVINKIFDPCFVSSDMYASLVCNDIPKRNLLDIAIIILRDRDKGDCKKLKYSMEAIISRMDEHSILDLYNAINDELMESQTDNSLITILDLFSIEHLSKLNDTTRLRTEGRILASIQEGCYYEEDEMSGYLGTYLKRLPRPLILHDKIVETMIFNLNHTSPGVRRYVYEHCFTWLMDNAGINSNKLNVILCRRLKSGDSQLYDELKLYYDWSPDNSPSNAVKAELESFNSRSRAIRPGVQF